MLFAPEISREQRRGWADQSGCTFAEAHAVTVQHDKWGQRSVFFGVTLRESYTSCWWLADQVQCVNGEGGIYWKNQELIVPSLSWNIFRRVTTEHTWLIKQWLLCNRSNSCFSKSFKMRKILFSFYYYITLFLCKSLFALLSSSLWTANTTVTTNINSVWLIKDFFSSLFSLK